VGVLARWFHLDTAGLMPRDPETEGGEYTLCVPKYRKIKIMLLWFIIHETIGGYIFVKVLLCR
jgi:hypothetical protein